MAIKELINRASKAIKLKSRTGSSVEMGDKAKSADNGQTVMVRKKPAAESRSLELIQHGLADLITQLKDINQNLSQQSKQNEQLMSRIEHLPEMIQTLPEAVKNQSSSVKALLDQLEDNQKKELDFVRAVESIPKETGKQTDALENIASQLSASAEVDVQFSESFNQFKTSLAHMDETTKQHSDAILRMNKTFTASDRYMKYVISRQNKRFFWLFITGISVTVFAVVALIIVFGVLISKIG